MGTSLSQKALMAAAALIICTAASADTGPAFSLSLLGNNAEVDLSKVLASSWTVPSLCAAATYTLSGAYSLVGVCTDDPPFTITVSVDGNAIYSPTGLADNFTVPIPASITEQPGSHMFSIVFSGGTYSNSASCADVLGFGLPSNSLKVSVVNCTDTSATGNLPGSTAAAAAGDAATTAEGVDISPVTLSKTNLQDRLMAHKVHIEDSVERASEAAAEYVRQQFG
ncbi:hypothetical protein COCSUDRAFT_44360 [Coccomyxa subellipsoidea C-169]|uniref:Uncharacterized protein n=1 Tax=Coccomyxa subellipsoidea (strain C-169) TaxID=574566 RepID=I0YNJ7_COCSC|nr:hypothetical protein COCSUDRAFT_44360 [Coccomyxa subellipsoidea C-169]EIE19966.1 hypothetical protein COCSUDRAFT_44360 [Coccomyxa subellipsoidea C-169]|eukprot:XP_005644510.1 hypothetical protein COCSUDRAFT_44360 [Coccomyxa subellipsoidea C-169]